MTRYIKAARLAISVVVCQLAGLAGYFFTASSVPSWYGSLAKPSFNPPYWVFSPVWITLYALMGISLYLVWQKGLMKKNVKAALIAFGIQLALNILWTVIFFGLRSPFYAFIEIIFLWAAILLTIINFYKVSKYSAYLLVPYILWVSFAIALNFVIIILN